MMPPIRSKEAGSGGACHDVSLTSLHWANTSSQLCGRTASGAGQQLHRFGFGTAARRAPLLGCGKVHTLDLCCYW
jgi:hypothetical protein